MRFCIDALMMKLSPKTKHDLFSKLGEQRVWVSKWGTGKRPVIAEIFLNQWIDHNEVSHEKS